MVSTIEKSGAAICKVCGSEKLTRFPEFSVFPRVTSDCRPFPSGGDLTACSDCGAVQKLVTQKWLEEIGQIYGVYQAYHQADGYEEQIVFDAAAGKPRRRSDVLMERLVETTALPIAGTVLDVGCGNGVTLRAINHLLPEWGLYGHDINEYQLDRLTAMPAFRGLLSGKISDIQRIFDLVTLIHSLEHFSDPLDALHGLSSRITNGGALFIEVCNLKANPFDLLVADHLMHFTPTTLSLLVERAGLTVTAVHDNWVGKEISLIGTQTSSSEHPRLAVPTEAAKESADFVTAALIRLREFVERAQHAAQEGNRFGLFGTSIAGTWLASQLGDAIDFFVDEDESRVGRTYLGKPIVRPRDVPSNATVYLALSPMVSDAIAARLSSAGFDIVTPPAPR